MLGLLRRGILVASLTHVHGPGPMSLWRLQRAARQGLRSGRPTGCSLHTGAAAMQAQGPSPSEVSDDLVGRLKDRGLLRLQGFIGGHWVRS